MSEKQYVLNMIEQFAKPGATFAMVADSYNIYDFCTMVGSDPDIKSAIDSHGATGGFVVIRPDSGDPVEVMPKMIQILSEGFGYTTNDKGYKVLNNVRVLWGDGINELSIRSILTKIVDFGGWSADNIAFGMGGALLQQLDRDTQKFALKASSACINGTWVDIQKDPITDPGKKSKAGRVELWESGEEYLSSVEQPKGWTDQGFEWKPVLQKVFENGKLYNEISFEEVRANANK
jgi:nicotinamide phosphoribosyltransferase